MTRSHVLLHCPNPKLRAARAEAWEGKNPGGVRVLLANPRWERRFVRFLELSGDGKVWWGLPVEEGVLLVGKNHPSQADAVLPRGRGDGVRSHRQTAMANYDHPFSDFI